MIIKQGIVTYSYLYDRIQLLYFLPLPESMENNTLTAIVANMHQLLSRIPPAQTSPTTESSPTSHFQTEFYAQATSLTSKIKLQIGEALQRMANVDTKEPLSNIQLNMLKVIRLKLMILNRDNNYLFEEGILTIYEDLCGLQKTCHESQIRQSIYLFVNETLQYLKDLFLHYFLYQEYLHRKQHQDKQREQLVDKKDERIAEDRSLIELIKKEWEGVSIQELLQREVKKHQDKIKDAVEMCRICFSNILITHIEEHVTVCQKHNSLQQLKRQCQTQIIETKAQLKKKYQQTQLNHQNREQQLEFMGIARLIISHQQKTKEFDRRCSLVEKGKVRQVEDIRKIIDDFIDASGEQPLLSRISQLYKQKAYIEKQLTYIEAQSHHHNKHQGSSGKLVDKSSYSIKSKVSAQKENVLLKKQSSLVEDNQSYHSFAKSQSESQKQFDFKQKSKRCLSKNALKKDQQQPLCPIVKYSSLQQIIIAESDTIKKNVSLQSFQFLKVLGEGAFGKVYMVRRKETRDIYALKIIKMPQSNIQNSLQSIKKEHSIFKKIAGEHLVKAPFSFSQRSCHFFILQYLPGGDLRKLLNEQVYLQEDRARAYLAEIILAIEHLHHFDVIHRDLKPQNLVFDRTGHLKLTDFGLSQFQMKQKLQKSHKEQKERIKKTRKRREAVLSSNKQKMKLIGTPDYIAPEIIFKISSNNFSIDWWSLGVMAYQLMIGARPFCAESIQEVIDNITKFNIEWPEEGYEEGMISPEAKDLICQLLNKDFMHRLGANGAEEIKKHPFFAKICWETIKTEKPLAMPKITNIRNYDKMEEDTLLRKEISNIMERGEGKRKVELQQFVRFDLLGRETLQSSHMAGQKQRKKLKTLKFLQCNFAKGDELLDQA